MVCQDEKRLESPPTKISCMEQFDLMKLLDNYLDTVAQALEDSDPDEVHQPNRTK